MLCPLIGFQILSFLFIMSVHKPGNFYFPLAFIYLFSGFSRETVAAFKTGFPEDWKELIHDHFNNSSLLDG